MLIFEVAIIASLGLLFFWIPLFFSPRYKAYSQQIVRLKRIMQSKKGAGTVGLETLAKVGMAAAGVAGLIAMSNRGHQQRLADKGAYGRIDIHKK